MKLVPFKILTLLLSTLLLQICYYLSLYEGQMRIQLGEKRIESVLQDSKDLHPVAKHRLKLILSVRKFAAETLGLKTGKNYLYYYDTLGRAPSYVVIAAYPTKLAYYYRVFPFVGKLPYKGYFYLHAAQAEYERLKKRGLDVVIYPVSAFSTLGWFVDPVFSTMLYQDEVKLVGLIIHELLHNTVFKFGCAEFNESLAVFYEREGTLLYIEKTLGRKSEIYKYAQKRFADEDTFIKLVSELISELKVLYAKRTSEDFILRSRQEIFEKYQRKYLEARKTGGFKTDEYDWFAKVRLNNAIILNIATYKFNFEIYEKIKKLAGSLRAALRIFKLAAEQDNPFAFLADYAKKKGGYNGIIYLTDGYLFDEHLDIYNIPTLFAIGPGGKKD